MDKNAPILEVLARLRSTFGPAAFQIVDHWSADREAIGIARSDDPDVLAYISTYGQPTGCHSVHLEAPRASGAEFLYQPMGEHEHVSYDQLARLLATHLGLPTP